MKHLVGIVQVDSGEALNLGHAAHERRAVNEQLFGRVGRVLTVAQETHERASVLGTMRGVVIDKRCQGFMAEQFPGNPLGAFSEQVIECVVAEAVIPVMRVARLPDDERLLGEDSYDEDDVYDELEDILDDDEVPFDD